MKKNFILFFFCFLVIITFTIFYYNSNQNQPVLQILFDQDIYAGSEERSTTSPLALNILYFHNGHIRHENTAIPFLSADGK